MLCNLQEIESYSSALQRVVLYRHPRLGLVLLINDEVQHVEAWQALYHEPLVHVPAAFIPTLRSVLILGGGSLYAAAEVLRYRTVRECVLVDHDAGVPSLLARHCRHAARVLTDARFRLEEADVFAFLRTSWSRFDLIINDCFDSVQHARVGRIPLGRLLRERLNSQGVYADLVYRHLLEPDYVARTCRVLMPLGDASASLVSVPEYPGILHFLTMWGTRVDQRLSATRNDVQRRWLLRRPTGLQFFDPRYLAFHLYLPPFAKRLWSLSR